MSGFVFLQNDDWRNPIWVKTINDDFRRFIFKTVQLILNHNY